MHYDPNYKGQIFWNSSNAIGIDEVLGLLRREFSTQEFKTPMPRPKPSKIIRYSLLGLIAVLLLATATAWILTKSVVYSIVIMVIGAVYVVGFMCLIIAFLLNHGRKACSVPVEAVCIGYSLSGGGDTGANYGGQIERSPVFQYEFQGYNWTAFDGMYDNFSKLPMMATPTKILVNPDDPEDIVWNFKKGRERFLILGGIFALVFCTAMMFVVHNDDNFMNSVIPARAAAVAAQKEKEADLGEGETPSGVETLSEEGEYVPRMTEDGRIILDEKAFRNDIWAYFPDSEYIVKVRKVTELEVLEEDKVYIVHFEEDPDFTDSEWFFTGEDVTDEVKNVSPGDEFIYTEIPEVGATKIFSVKEYVLDLE